VTSFFGIISAFLAFSQVTRQICAKFFSRFRRKHLFISTCIEKQCIRPSNVHGNWKCTGASWISHSLPTNCAQYLISIL